MLGSIIGDIIGSRFEGHNSRIKTTDFELFDKGSKFTDDTVLTIAVADWLMQAYFFDSWELNMQTMLKPQLKRCGKC